MALRAAQPLGGHLQTSSLDASTPDQLLQQQQHSLFPTPSRRRRVVVVEVEQPTSNPSRAPPPADRPAVTLAWAPTEGTMDPEIEAELQKLMGGAGDVPDLER